MPMEKVWFGCVGLPNLAESRTFRCGLGGYNDNWTMRYAFVSENAAAHENERRAIKRTLELRTPTTNRMRDNLIRMLREKKNYGYKNTAVWDQDYGSRRTIKAYNPPLVILVGNTLRPCAGDDTVQQPPSSGIKTLIFLNPGHYASEWKDKNNNTVNLGVHAREIILWHELGHITQFLEDPVRFYAMNNDPNYQYTLDTDNLKRHEHPLCRDLGVGRRWIYESMGRTAQDAGGDHDFQKRLKTQRQNWARKHYPKGKKTPY